MTVKPVNRVQLQASYGRRFDSSIDFLNALGHGIDQSSIFLPMPTPAEEGETVRFRFELSGGREILAGEGVVEAVRSGANGETPGCHIRFTLLSERSRKNLAMILDWRASQS